MHRDRYDRLIPLELALPFGTSLYLRDGFCLCASGRPYHYDEFTTGRSQAIEPSADLRLFRLGILERLGCDFRIDRWTSGPLAGWSVTLPFWFAIAVTVLRATAFFRRGRPNDPRGTGDAPDAANDVATTSGVHPTAARSAARRAARAFLLHL
jgi:hypothetical protein